MHGCTQLITQLVVVVFVVVEVAFEIPFHPLGMGQGCAHFQIKSVYGPDVRIQGPGIAITYIGLPVAGYGMIHIEPVFGLFVEVFAAKTDPGEVVLKTIVVKQIVADHAVFIGGKFAPAQTNVGGGSVTTVRITALPEPKGSATVYLAERLDGFEGIDRFKVFADEEVQGCGFQPSRPMVLSLIEIVG